MLSTVFLLTSDCFAQSSVTQKPLASHRNWAINCAANPSNGKQQCQISQILTAEKTGQRILTVVIRSIGVDNKLSLLIALPHGLYLPTGIVFQVDNNKTKRATIQTSDAKGVYAVIALTNAFFNTMKSGKVLKVSMQSVKRQTITLAVSLAGFTAAAKKITNAKQ